MLQRLIEASLFGKKNLLSIFFVEKREPLKNSFNIYLNVRLLNIDFFFFFCFFFWLFLVNFQKKQGPTAGQLTADPPQQAKAGPGQLKGLLNQHATTASE